MRLYIPNKNLNADEDEDEDKKSVSGQSEKSGDQNEQKHSAEILKEQIMKYANVGTLEKTIAHVTEVPMITPRGKFDLYFLKNILKIHGPSHDYKISYRNMAKAFLLPKPDGTHFNFVVGLNNPLRQGNTTYPFLVFQLKTKNEKTVELNLPEDEEERKEILKSEINQNLKGELFDIMAKLFKALIGIAVVIPGNFRSSRGGSCIRCSLKASEGYIYPLERGLIFIHKPVVYINLDDISHVEFSRVSESSAQQRTFDLTIKKRNEEIQFLGVEKNELDLLTKYFANKKIKIKSNDEGNIQEIKPSVKYTYIIFIN
jgi:structure-specific recognition protein 1